MNLRKKIPVLALLCIFALSGCQSTDGMTADKKVNETTTVRDADEDKDSNLNEDMAGSDSVVIYFNRVGNTDFSEEVDAATSASLQVSDSGIKGNAQVIAEWIADEVGCDAFEIVTAEKYPEDYDETVEIAKREQSEDARPVLVNAPDLEGYDVVYLVFPNWWADMPMPVYSFIEQNDFSGKKIVVFITHEESRFSGTIDTIKGLKPDVRQKDRVRIEEWNRYRQENR